MFKIFLKKDTQKIFFDWSNAVLSSNISRTKEGNRLGYSKVN